MDLEQCDNPGCGAQHHSPKNPGVCRRCGKPLPPQTPDLFWPLMYGFIIAIPFLSCIIGLLITYV